MARRRKSKSTDGQISEWMRKHLEMLGVRRTQEYYDWCLDRGFPQSLEKSRQELYVERDAFRRGLERAKSQAKLHRKPRQLIEKACSGMVHPDEVTRPNWHEFCRSIYESNAEKAARQSLCGLLLTVNKKAGFLFESVTFGPHTYRYVDALIRLNDRRGQWIRPVEGWRAASHNPHRQFSSLVRHLLTRYPVPHFMDSAWFRDDQGAYDLRNWFIHVGSGKNIRTAKTPVPLTKRMAHYFTEAPDHYSIEHAIRWGQIHSLGGDRRLTEAILGTPIGDDFRHEDFWNSAFRFFVANPLLDRKHVGPIVDYLNHQKFETREVVIGPGRVELQEPPQPNLSMRGRTPERLLRLTEGWHRELGRSRAAEGRYFKRSGVQEFEMKVGKDKKNTWRIRELLSGAALVAEGKAMRHCVASYADSCAHGHCSIWAMELHTPSGVRKHQTVEVSQHGMVVQSRGKLNRPPTHVEFEILKRWARAAGLVISSYVGF